MRSSLTVAAAVLASIAGHASAQLTLTWSDEFDGNTLNLDNWEYQVGTGTLFGLPAGWGNNELQYYTSGPNNTEVSNGTLKITARNESFAGRSYTSARLRTINKVDFLYGRVEARMKLPSTPGAWPAFWMLATDSPYGGWASSGEIDVMESVNFADRIYGTIHYGGFFPSNQSNGNSIVTGTDYGAGFHEYAVEWLPDEIRWYLDGQLYHTVSAGQWFSVLGSGNVRAPFDSPFHMLLNVAVGGNFPGNPNGSSQWPQTLEVDYVRVYQVENGPFGAGPASVPGQIEAEDFDTGYSGLAYRDSDVGNNGGAYRDGDVDIEVSSEGGFNVGFIAANEFLEYTIDVADAGDYLLEMRLASPQIGGPFRVEFDGVDATGALLAPFTGDFQNWTTISQEVALDAGEQVMRFTTAGGAGGFNLNWFRLTRVGGCSVADLAEPFGTLNFFDVSAYIAAYNTSDPAADLASPFGTFNFFDVSAYITEYNAGCP